MWGLHWGLLCGTSDRKDLCMMPCHGCHIFGICTSRSKKVWGCLKVINWRWRCQWQKGGSFHREGGFSLCKTAELWNFIASLTGYIYIYIYIYIYTVKDFIGYLFSLYYCCFTCLRLAKPKFNSKCPNGINTELGYSRKIFTLLLKIPYP